uniref:30S ribosomal protein S21 n=1 Tax=Ornithobacterium rhinotracheale TaxID=28251 RepID=UPI0039A770F9
MLIVPVKDGESIERALKRYKRKYDRTKIVKELRERQQFTKPSVIRRQEIIRASYKQKMQSKNEL